MAKHHHNFRTIGLLLFILTSLFLSGCKKEEIIPIPNPTDTSQTSKEEPVELSDRVIATFTSETNAAHKFNFPTIVEDYLYIGTSTKLPYDGDHEAAVSTLPENFFYKMDLDLNPLWSYSLGKTMVSGGATLDSKGNIYFVTVTVSANNKEQDKTKFFRAYYQLMSLTNDGKYRWTVSLSQPDGYFDNSMYNIALSQDDILYVGHDKFYAIDTEGKVLWAYPEDDRIFHGFASSPSIDQLGNIYFVSPIPTQGGQENDQITAYKFTADSNGKPEWTQVLDNSILDPEGGTSAGGGFKERTQFGIPAFTKDQSSFYVAVGNTINKVSTQTGAIEWSLKPELATGHINATTAVDGNDTIYFGTKSNIEGRFYAISSEGKELWSTLIGADMYDSPFLGDDGAVYVASEQTDHGNVFALDQKTGDIRWSIGKSMDKKQGYISDASSGSMALYKGYAYLGVHQVTNADSDGLLKIKVDAESYPVDASWPCLHGSNENTGRVD